MASACSAAEPLETRTTRHPAYAILTGFLVSVFFLNGGAANTTAILCFVAAWALIIYEARTGTLSVPSIAPILLAFLTAINLRLLLPPYGADGVVAGAAITRGLLLVGLYGLTLYAYARLRFQAILWLLVGTAFVCTIVSLAVYAFHPPTDYRLVFLGRAAHPIFGAGAIATGSIAAITLLAYGNGTHRGRIITVLLAVCAAALVVGIYLTGSRGPLLALAFALCAAPLALRSGSRLFLFASAFGAWALVTATVLIEAPIKAALCPAISIACRDSRRHEVWQASADRILQHPLWGSGYAFRFEGDVPHAHDAYLGMALHYGIPLGILFICLMVAALSRAARLRDKQQRFFVVTMLVFANGFMGSDLSDPVRFFNTHYLFLWLPLFLAMVGDEGDARPQSDAKPASVAHGHTGSPEPRLSLATRPKNPGKTPVAPPPGTR